jgi:hypothetical protein
VDTGAASWPLSRERISRPKARTLPDPVGGIPHTSRPVRLSAIAIQLSHVGLTDHSNVADLTSPLMPEIPGRALPQLGLVEWI